MESRVHRSTSQFRSACSCTSLALAAAILFACHSGAFAAEPQFEDEVRALTESIENRDREIKALRRRVAHLQGIESDEPEAAAPAPHLMPVAFQQTPPAAPGVEVPESDEPAETTDPSYEDILRRLETLENAQKESAAEKPAEKKAEGGDKKGGDKKDEKADDGWIDLSTDKWTVKLSGHLQGDYITWADADPAIPNTQNYFEFRRARLTADGTGYGLFEFRIMFDVEPEADNDNNVTGPVTELKDAYLSFLEFEPLGKVRFGNFFVPFSLEQVTNDTMNIFLERSIPTQGIFAADREVGAAVYNNTEDKSVAWAYGVFFDSISDSLKERVDDNQGYRVSGRLSWVPIYDEPSKGRYLLHTGTGILHTSDHDDRVRFRARPQIHEGPRLIDSGILDANTYTTGNVEAAIVAGPFSVQSEAFLCNVNMNTGDSVLLDGAYVYASYYLTGENRQYERDGMHGAQFGRPAVFTNFFSVPGCCGTGAWELKARMSYLGMNDIDRGQYNDFTAGFNWYWSERIRLMFDWIHPMTSEEATFGETESDILGTRLDFNF